MIKRWSLALVILVLVGLVSVFAQDFRKVEAGGMSIEWRITGPNLEMRLTAPTTGWVSVGFNPSVMMKDADYILAYVRNGQGVVSDDFGNGPTMHRPDTDLGGKANVELVSASEQAGATTVQFRIPLESGDKYDKVLKPGAQVKLLWAFGPDGADNFTSRHKARGSLSITL